MQDAGEMRGRINNRKRLGACRTLLQLGGRLVSVRGAGVKMWHSWVCKDVGGMHAMAFWGLRGLKRGVRDSTGGEPDRKNEKHDTRALEHKYRVSVNF